jgi:AcrR family transcriptional regulator
MAAVSDSAKEKLLQAALEEFGAKGYSGARTAGVAARAGVNQQLISYYFGGKQGLLRALRERWAAAQAEMTPPDEVSFQDSVAGYLDATLDRPDWARLVLWQALGDDPGYDDAQHAAQNDGLRASVDRVRRRQAEGELRDDVDPEFVLLLAYALVFAPIALPWFVEAVFGVDPASPEYRTRCLEQLMRLLEANDE